MRSLLLAAMAALLAGMALAAPETTGGSACITDPAGWYRDSPEKIERRFALYRNLGVETLRVEIDWRSCEPEEGRWDGGYLRNYLALAQRYGFRIKLICGVLMAPPKWFLDAHPDARIVDENGRYSTNTLSFWYPGLRPLIEQKTRKLIELLKGFGVLDRVDSVIPALGPAGEPIYPVPWTLGPDVTAQTYWCYDENAQRDFRARMRRNYRTLEAANRRWQTTFTTWEAVRVLPPGTRPGPYWEDVLRWYRDTKRDFIRWQAESIRRHFGRKRPVILYIPGTAYSEADWQEAVQTARGNDHIMMMADSRFLIDLAGEKGYQMQYTGCENEPEVAALRTYLDSRDYRNVVMWGENAGVWGAAKDPLRLAAIVRKYRLYGLDYTHAHWVFERDGITPNAVFPLLKEAYARLK